MDDVALAESDSDNELSALDGAPGVAADSGCVSDLPLGVALASLGGAFESGDAANSEGVGVAATVMEDSSSIACASGKSCFQVASPGGSSRHKSLDCHTIHVHAPSRLASASVGTGVGDGVGVSDGVGGIWSSGGVNLRANAWLVGTLHDVIHSVPACANSRTQGFTEYHDDSCARLNALLDARVERGHCGREGTKLSSTGALCKARRPAEKKPAFSQQESGKLHVETWAGCKERLSLKISQAKETQMRCAVSVFLPRPSFSTPALPGPGSDIRRMMGWTQVGKTERSGLWWFPGALKRRDIFPVLCAAVDSDNELLFGERGEAKLIASVSFGTRAR